MKRILNSYDRGNFGDNPKRLYNNDKRESENIQNTEVPNNLQNYVDDLLLEKSELEKLNLKHTVKLLDEEILKVRSTGRITRESNYVNVLEEKPIKVIVKVSVPVQEHPLFNFVGKLLGPKGNTFKRLQQETMCKMSILGKGSMKNPQKEEELKATGDPKYAHLSEELHVEICAFGPPAVAHSKMSYALGEIRKYLIPDKHDAIRQEQFRELESLTGSGTSSSRNSYGSHDSRYKFSVQDNRIPSMGERYNYNEPDPYSRSHGYDVPCSPAYRYDKFENTRSSPVESHRRTASANYGDLSSLQWKPSGAPQSRHSEQSGYRSTSYTNRPMKDTY